MTNRIELHVAKTELTLALEEWHNPRFNGAEPRSIFYRWRRVMAAAQHVALLKQELEKAAE